MLELTDSHCHLDFSCFDSDRSEILARCANQSINNIIVPGTQAKGWEKQIMLCHHYPQLRFALGLHPYFLDCYQAKDLDRLGQLIVKYKAQIVALGEIGLDHAIDIDHQRQLTVFTKQLSLADEHHLPVILHHRQSHNELLRCLKGTRFSHGGIVHAFSGSFQQANTYIELGFKIGVGGGITYQRANKTRETIRQLPLSSIVLETDSPDMPLMGRQGSRNSPEYLTEIVDSLQILRNESRSEIIQACENNLKACLTNL